MSTRAASPGASATPFLPYLEGLRGITAFYVVLFHVRHYLERDYAPFGPSANLLPLRGFFLLYGHYAVSVFIVISGFVLTLPIVLRGAIPGGRRGFFMRRARRLFPAYYVALFATVPLYLIRLSQDGAHTTAGALAVQLLAHATFLHDFSSRTIYGIDGPMWSVAVEVQIYVGFIFVLLPVLRRWSLWASIAVAFAIGFAPVVVGSLTHRTPDVLELACFWYLGLFAFGAAAAFIAHGAVEPYATLRTRVPWKWLAGVGAVLFGCLALRIYDDRYDWPLYPAMDTLLGAVIAAGFIAIAHDIRSGRRSIVASCLTWKPFVLLGSFSYSLYLIHEPIVRVVMHAIFAFPPPAKLAIGFLVLVPAITVLAYVFGRIFETPFVSSARRAADAAVIHAAPHEAAAVP